MNEIRDLIVGIDFGKEYSQICYYDRKGDEARFSFYESGWKISMRLPVFCAGDRSRKTIA